MAAGSFRARYSVASKPFQEAFTALTGAKASEVGPDVRIEFDGSRAILRYDGMKVLTDDELQQLLDTRKRED